MFLSQTMGDSGGREVFIFSMNCFGERVPNFLVEVVQTLDAIYLIFKLDGNKVIKSIKALALDRLDLNLPICTIWRKLLISLTFYPL